jgi:chorismate mutase
MDRLNARLVVLLQQRARLALAIGRAKRRRGLAAADPARERAMLRAALAGAATGFSRRELQRLLRAVFAASRALVVRDRGGNGRAGR